MRGQKKEGVGSQSFRDAITNVQIKSFATTGPIQATTTTSIEHVYVLCSYLATKCYQKISPSETLCVYIITGFILHFAFFITCYYALMLGSNGIFIFKRTLKINFNIFRNFIKYIFH